MTYDKIKNNGKKIVIVVIVTISLILMVSYFILKDSIPSFGQEDLDRIIENKRTGECVVCHTAGQKTVIAKDTIDMSSSCYECHREDIDFLVPVSKEVHIYHKGDPSILPGYPSDVDYSLRHKEILGSCENCHIYESNKSPSCIRCHSGDHVDSKKGVDCLSCHGSLDDLFTHKTINIETHNIFGDRSCDMCHSSDKISLELVNGNRIPITQSSRLCKQCHSRIYEEWEKGDHIYNIECSICHDPHSPKYVNQTIIDVANDIRAAEMAKETPPKPQDTNIIPMRKYDYDTVQE